MSWLGAIRMLSAPRSARPELRLLRARERELRERIRALPPGARRQLRADATGLPALRERIVALTGAPRCCAGCASPTPWGGQSLPGGLCCSGTSEAIFTLLELAPLVLADRAPGDHAVADPHSGCVFRGASGCLLPAASRPSICLGHLCHELAGELHARGVIAELLAAAEELAARTRSIGEVLGPTDDPPGVRYR